MVTTRSRGAVVPERTALQLQRDHVAAQMNLQWPSLNNRPHMHSRGILNGPQLCYQSAVLQGFMHQGPFLHWILQHNAVTCLTSQCIKCHLKTLAQQYWGANAITTITNNAVLKGIADISHQSSFFEPGQQECANLFFNWITDTLKESPDSINWKRQHDSLYCLTLQYHDRCRACGVSHEPAANDNTFISLGIDPGHTNITEAIVDTMQHQVEDLFCERCESNQTKTRWTEIIAAPKILRVQLQILLYNEKIFQTLSYPDMLDLTAYQQIPTLPLRYQLSSVVAHAGDYTTGRNHSDTASQTAAEILEAASLAEAERLQLEEYALLESSLESPVFYPNQLTHPLDTATVSAIATADQEPATPSHNPSQQPSKVMQGHYVASVREPDGTFSTVDDARVQRISHAQFLTNPQQSRDRDFQVYILTYIRDDRERLMPVGSRRWLREVSGLRTGGVGESRGAEGSRVRSRGRQLEAGKKRKPVEGIGETVQSGRKMKRKRGKRG